MNRNYLSAKELRLGRYGAIGPWHRVYYRSALSKADNLSILARLRPQTGGAGSG